MFKKQVISTFLIWLLVVLGCFKLLYTSSSDVDIAYQRLMGYSAQIKQEQEQDNIRSTRQTREQVSKQIFYKKGDERLQTVLRSVESFLDYSKQDGEFVEHFKGLTCIMQEKLVDLSDPPIEVVAPIEVAEQMIRQLQAQEAIYSYTSGKLNAKEVEIAHYLFPGHECPHSLKGFHPILQGKALTLQLSLFQEPNMQAQGFQAIFHDWENNW